MEQTATENFFYPNQTTIVIFGILITLVIGYQTYVSLRCKKRPRTLLLENIKLTVKNIFFSHREVYFDISIVYLSDKDEEYVKAIVVNNVVTSIQNIYKDDPKDATFDNIQTAVKKALPITGSEHGIKFTSIVLIAFNDPTARRGVTSYKSNLWARISEVCDMTDRVVEDLSIPKEQVPAIFNTLLVNVGWTEAGENPRTQVTVSSIKEESLLTLAPSPPANENNEDFIWGGE